MQGPIAQAVALTLHGNAALGGTPETDPTRLLSENSTFTFCESVRFVSVRRRFFGAREEHYADAPAEWLARLGQERVTNLRLVRVPTEAASGISDRMGVAFVGGGGRWLVEANRAGVSDFWEGRWEVGDQTRTDQKIWRVTYGRVAEGAPAGDTQHQDLDSLKARLALSLESIRAFAIHHGLDVFVQSFDKARHALASQEPLPLAYHQDLAPPGRLSLPAAQLLASVQNAWVFGGMGSWNDLGFAGEELRTYDRLSEDLFQLLQTTIVAAVDSSLSRSGGR
jgi:hypothetical protein